MIKHIGRMVVGVWVLGAVLAPGGIVGQEPANAAEAEAHYGFLYSHFRLNLSNGARTEVLGPFYYQEVNETNRTRAVPPLFSWTHSDLLDFTEFDVLYPLLTYDRFGEEYRFQLAQWFSFAGGQTSRATNVHRFTLFPVYFQQRSDIPERNYTAVMPFYGRLQNRFWRDETHFVMFPLYVRTRKRDVATSNYLFPLFHIRRGDELVGWQLWPLFGHESKRTFERTNLWNELETVPGHRKIFAVWPFFHHHQTELGTTNPISTTAFLPLFSAQRSPTLDLIAFPWPFGFVYTEDRAKRFKQWSMPWPFIMFARGEGKTINRVFPLFSRGHTPVVERNSYLWPLYHESRVRSAPLDRKRRRVLLFLISDVVDTNTATDQTQRRRLFWPFFSWHQDRTGNKRFQMLALLEPILAEHKAIERNYSPLWALWRSDYNARADSRSQSFLWNLYRREATPDSRKYSLLFGLFQYQSTPQGKQGRIGFVPWGSRPTEVNVPPESAP